MSTGPLRCADPSLTSEGKPDTAGRSQNVITVAIILGPLVAIGVILPLLWGHAVNLSDVLMGVSLYVITGFGITVGYHRMFTHGSFQPHRWLKIVLALVGSMAVEGSVTSWVATHRRHHIYSDRDGDPHTPHRYGDRGVALLKGLAFAHVGWLFVSDHSSARRYAPDLLRDRDIRRIDRLFPVIALVSLSFPFGIGYLLSGSLAGGISALTWAGLVRMGLLHHVTWSVNSICHMFGKQTAETGDRSTNVRALALVSLGESWHNVHHAHPTWARHGALKGMIDPSAGLIRLFERLGWVARVRWPSLAGLPSA